MASVLTPPSHTFIQSYRVRRMCKKCLGCTSIQVKKCHGCGLTLPDCPFWGQKLKNFSSDLKKCHQIWPTMFYKKMSAISCIKSNFSPISGNTGLMLSFIMYICFKTFFWKAFPMCSLHLRNAFGNRTLFSIQSASYITANIYYN